MASFHTTSRRTAVAGVLAAGSLAVLWLACMVPSGRIGLTGAAGLFPVAAVLAAGRAAGYLCWAASALLGLFLLPDKGVALLYLIFLGLYPVVKNNIEGLRRLPLECCASWPASTRPCPSSGSRCGRCSCPIPLCGWGRGPGCSIWQGI